MKICKKCGVKKEPTTKNFYRKIRNADGLDTCCIRCRTEIKNEKHPYKPKDNWLKMIIG